MENIKISVKKSIILNADDRLYMAMITVYDKPNYAVYTLGHNRSNGAYYYMIPNVQVANFTNKQDADLYHDAIENIMDYQQNNGLVAKKIKEYDTEEIVKFYNGVHAGIIGINKTLEKQK